MLVPVVNIQAFENFFEIISLENWTFARTKRKIQRNSHCWASASWENPMSGAKPQLKGSSKPENVVENYYHQQSCFVTLESW